MPTGLIDGLRISLFFFRVVKKIVILQGGIKNGRMESISTSDKRCD